MLFLAVLAMAAFNFNAKSANALDCDTLTGDAKDECEKLEKKAKTYQSIINLKNKQQDTLTQQIGVIDQEQAKNLQSLQLTQTQLNELIKKIGGLEEDIKNKEIMMETKKKMLSTLMQSYYEYDQEGVLKLMMASNDLSSILNQTDYIEQSGEKVSEILSDIEKSRDEVIQEKSKLDKKREENEKLKEQLADRKFDLQASENQKQSLLTQTQGEEAKYKDMLAHVEKQQRELFNFSEASNLSEVSESVGKYPKPSSNLASTSWYFSQKDSRWANQRIGNSSSLMKDYGCAVTCVSMVFKKHGSGTNPGRMAKEKIFYYDLIKWPSTWSPGITLASSVSHGNIKWSTVDAQIKKGNPVIVYIKKTNGRGGHYVVVTGKDSKDYIVHDPYFGANLYLGTSKSLVGKIGANSKTVVDQMIVYK